MNHREDGKKKKKLKLVAKLSKKGGEPMHKRKALILGVLCAGLGILLYSNDPTVPLWLFIVIAALLLSVGIYPYIRDHRIVAQARLEQEQPAQVSQPPMTSKGSRVLFIPPPMN